MKKKLMMVAVLLGALSLGACVDDNESASVTAVREAKAEQLSAMAALYKAQAEAELIYANAEKALKEAQAAWQNEMTEQAKQEFAIKIEQIKAEAEAAIAKAKLQAAQDEQALLDLADERVTELYAEYRNALSGIIYLQNRKIELTSNIAKAEAGLVPIQTLADNQIAYYQKLIDLEEYKIELYNQYKGADLVELQQQAAKADQEYKAAEDVATVKYAAQQEANNAYNEEATRFYMWNDVTNPIKTVAAARELYNINWYLNNTNHNQLSDSKNIDYYTLNATEVESEQQYLEGNVTSSKEYIGSEKDDETKGTLYGQLASLNKQKADALKADPNADVTGYDNAIALKEAEITEWSKYLKDAEEALAKFNALIASFSGDDLKAYDEAVAALTKLAEAYETAYDEYLDAQTASQKAWNEYNVANSLISQNDVEQLIAACQNQIAYYQQNQQNYKNNVTNEETLIAQYKSELTSIEGEITAQQAIIDILKAQIDAAIAAQE